MDEFPAFSDGTPLPDQINPGREPPYFDRLAARTQAAAASLRPRVGQCFALGVAELAAQVARDPRESGRPRPGALQMAVVYHRDDQYEEYDDPKS